MPSQRLIRVNELLKREIANALYRVMDDREFDLAAVTVTRVETSSDLRHARVALSVRADEHGQQAMLRALRKHRKDFQEVVGRNVVLKYNPYLRFELDDSVRQGDRILEILSELNVPDEDEIQAEEETEAEDEASHSEAT